MKRLPRLSRRPVSSHAQWLLMRVEEAAERVGLYERRNRPTLEWWFRFCDTVSAERLARGQLDFKAVERNLLAAPPNPQLQRFRRRLWGRYGDAWNAYDALVEHYLAAGNHIFQEAKTHFNNQEEYARALGRAGFGDGAGARARTALEIAVSADLLCDADADTVAHYGIQVLENMRRAAKSQAEHLVDLFGSPSAEDAEFARQRVREIDDEISRLVSVGRLPPNKHRRGAYWWAARQLERRGHPVMGSVTFQDAIAGSPLSAYAPFYYFFNAPVHAGRDALDRLYVDSESPGSGVFVTGPTDQASVDPAQVALSAVRSVTWSLVQASSGEPQRIDHDGRLGALLELLETLHEPVIRAMQARDPVRDSD